MKRLFFFILVLSVLFPITCHAQAVPKYFRDSIQIGNTSSENAGTFRWTGTDFEGYTGAEWKSLTTSAVDLSPYALLDGTNGPTTGVWEFGDDVYGGTPELTCVQPTSMVIDAKPVSVDGVDFIRVPGDDPCGVGSGILRINLDIGLLLMITPQCREQELDVFSVVVWEEGIPLEPQDFHEHLSNHSYDLILVGIEMGAMIYITGYFYSGDYDNWWDVMNLFVGLTPIAYYRIQNFFEWNEETCTYEDPPLAGSVIEECTANCNTNTPTWGSSTDIWSYAVVADCDAFCENPGDDPCDDAAYDGSPSSMTYTSTPGALFPWNIDDEGNAVLKDVEAEDIISDTVTVTSSLTLGATGTDTTYPIVRGNSGQFLQTNGSGSAGWSDVSIDRLIDPDTLDYIVATYEENYTNTRDGMKLQSSNGDLVLEPASGGVVYTSSPLYVNTKGEVNAQLEVFKYFTDDTVTSWDHGYGYYVNAMRGPGEALDVTWLYGLSFTVNDFMTTDGIAYQSIGLNGMYEGFPGPGVNIVYGTAGSFTAQTREGSDYSGTVTYLTSVRGYTRVLGDQGQTIPFARGVTAGTVLGGNSTITDAYAFMSAEGGAGSTGTIGTYTHFGLYSQATKAAGATFTTQYGFYSPDLSNAVTNYALYVSDFSDDTNDWGLYNLARSYFGEDTTLKDGKNLNLESTSGSIIASASTQKMAFWGATPVVQPSSTGITTGFTAGAGTNVLSDSSFTGNIGSTAYTIGDVVAHLKTVGLIAQ